MIPIVKKYIIDNNMISKGDEIIAGISGGADSVCMFLQLLEYRKQCDFTLKVVHINHMIRKDAGEDAAFVKKLCEENGIEFFLFNEAVEETAQRQGISTEEAGRNIRYERFRQVMSRKDAKIAVAHNKNDVAETVLFNIFRGTGLEGLASLTPVNGDIIRPILGMTREEIESYLESISQSYQTDSTNASNNYARNKIRNVILPYADENIASQTAVHIAEMSRKMLLLREYVRKETEKAYTIAAKETDDCVAVNVEKFIELDPMLQGEVILLAFEKLTPHRKDITGQHVEAILNLLEMNGEKRADLPYGLEAVKQYDKVLIRSLTDLDTVKEILPDAAIIADYNVYAYNNVSLAVLRDLGIDEIIYSVELNYRKLANLRTEGVCELMVYGRIPLMTSAGCIDKNRGKAHCKMSTGIEYFTDRMKAKTPYLAACRYCYNIIYNSVPLYIGDMKKEIKPIKTDLLGVHFTDEGKDEIDMIMDLVLSGASPDKMPAFTRGNFKSGAD